GVVGDVHVAARHHRGGRTRAVVDLAGLVLAAVRIRDLPLDLGHVTRARTEPVQLAVRRDVHAAVLIGGERVLDLPFAPAASRITWTSPVDRSSVPTTP